MTKFFFSHILKNPIRSLSIIGSITILFLTITGSVYLYKNITSAIEYYASHGNNEKRVTIASSANLLNIFNTESGMKESMIDDIKNNPLLENAQVFRLVSIPVSARFGFFSFSMESDIPIFSVTDSALSGAEIPVGMSRTMIDLYNTQFAGSSHLFPQMRESFLKWQKIDFTFGKSKIFQSSNNLAEPITGTITTFSSDFPWLGLVLPESIVKQKMAEIGFQMGSPYKIVAYIKNLDDKAKIEKMYSGSVTTRFEIDEIHETKQRIAVVWSIIFVIGSSIVCMFVAFFTFLLGWYFRERKNIFQMIALFGLKSVKSYIITVWEPIFLTIIAIIWGIFANVIFMNFFHFTLVNFIESHGIFFPLIPLSTAEIFLYGITTLFGISFVIGFFEWKNRKKYQAQ